MVETTVVHKHAFLLKKSNFTATNFVVRTTNIKQRSLFFIEDSVAIEFKDLQLTGNTYRSQVFEIENTEQVYFEKVVALENKFFGFLKLQDVKPFVIRNFDFFENTALGQNAFVEAINSESIFTDGSIRFKKVALGSHFFSFRQSPSLSMSNTSIILPDTKSVTNYQILSVENKNKNRSSFKDFTATCGEHFDIVKNVTPLSAADHNNELLNITCIRCPHNTFSMGTSSINIKDSSGNYNESISRTKCSPCPTGSTCYNNKLVARDNFYGFYQNETEDFRFVVCPKDYCCSKESQKCNSPTTCNLHRKGRFCGKCEEGYFVSIVNNKCVENSKCTTSNRQWFRTLFIITTLIIAVVLTGLKDFMAILKWFLKKIKQCHRRLFTNEEEEDPEEDKENCQFSSVFDIIYSFYQIKALITVATLDNTSLVDRFFNVEIVLETTKKLEKLCPSHDFHWRRKGSFDWIFDPARYNDDHFRVTFNRKIPEILKTIK
ncbi:uncharacterized protein [Clytia hemisphaerica]|uniref:uncharacterized protein n=1 Tax=Clytia hemisphaerica TaxID=252671 RepID=UPI0034D7348A